MERSYQDLNLRRENIDSYISEFIKTDSRLKIREDNEADSKRTIKFGSVGIEDATVILFFKKNGTTTITYKTGKNYDLGKGLADSLYETLDPSEDSTVNLVLKGVDTENVKVLLEELESLKDEEGEQELSITRHKTTMHSEKIEVTSNRYNDRLTIIHHHTTNRLQVQGRALFCYRNLTYFLAILLDQESLLSVISKSSDEERLLVRQEVARTHIENIYTNSYPRMEDAFRDLLVSSYCVKLAAPELSDYSMLIYPDLRVLEGVIKETLAKHGKHTDSDRIVIGDYFESSHGQFKIKDEHLSAFSAGTLPALEECYKFYRAQRHSLFHMSEMVSSSRMITTLGEVMSLSSDIVSKIEELYNSCDKL